jgi:hypothetical protein
MTNECIERRADPTEHRWGERVALPTAVKLTAGGSTLGHGVLRNLSVSGGFIDTAVKVPVFTNLVVCVQTTGPALGASPDLPACVVRTGPSGLAVEWRDMACDTLVALLGRSGTELAPRNTHDPAFDCCRRP